MLASKNDEMDDFIPIAKRVQNNFNILEMDRDAPSWEQLVEFEREALRSFDWNLKIPIPLNFT